jgi:hypothetical protein
MTSLVEDLTVVTEARDADPVFALHRGGKIEVTLSVPLETRDDLSMAYTPGVARVCTAIEQEPALVYDYTWKSRTVAVVTDGTAVLGLGDIGPAAALPVMEGKAMLFKHFGGIDAVPICLDVKDTDELIETIVRLAPAFGGINLEDISAPRCFEVERRVQERLDIPVFHDDQHGTAIVTLAALRNAAKLTGRTLADLRVVVSGAGAAGIAVSKMILEAGIGDLAIADSKGIVHLDRSDLNEEKRLFATISNKAAFTGSFDDALERQGPAGRRRVHGSRQLRVRDGQPRSGGAPRRRQAGRCSGDRHGPLGLPEPDQQRAGLPGRVPRGDVGAGHSGHRGHEAGCRARPGRRRRRRRAVRGVRDPVGLRRARSAGRQRGRGRGRSRRGRRAPLTRAPGAP